MPCVAQHPDLRKHLYTDDGKLRAFVNLYVNDEDIRYLQKEATALNDSDDISIVPSIAGRRGRLIVFLSTLILLLRDVTCRLSCYFPRLSSRVKRGIWVVPHPSR